MTNRLPLIDRFSGLFRDIMRFAGAGFGGFVVAFGGTAFLVEQAGWREQPAYAVMLLCLSIASFLVQRRFVFDERRGGQSARVQLVKFAGSIAGFRALEWGLFSAGVHFSSVPYFVLMPAVTLFSFFGKFLVYDRWVFKPKQPDI